MLDPTPTSEVLMRKIVLTFGLIAGAILSAMMLLTMPFIDSIGFDKSLFVGYATMVLAFLMIFFGVRAYRDNVAGGEISFLRGLSIGLLITAIASVCYVATWEVIYNTMMPDFADKYAAHQIDVARASGSAQKVAATEKEMADFKQMYRNPVMNAGMTFLEPLPVGVVFAIVTAGVLRRRRRTSAGVPVTA